MPRSLGKVQSKIAKKRGKVDSLHENSRDSQRIRRAGLRDDKLTRLSAARDKQKQPLLQRIGFFQQVVRQSQERWTSSRVLSLVANFIRRDDEALADLKKQRRPGRPSSTKEDLLKRRQVTEEKEFDTGFYMPDLEDDANVESLRTWNGEWTSLATMQYVRISHAGAKQAALFPPKGSA